MSAGEITPRPWRSDVMTGLVGDETWIVQDERRGPGVTQIAVLNNDDHEDDAAHIVRCVNAHEALVAALEALLADYIAHRDALYDSCTDAEGRYEDSEEGVADQRAVAGMDALIDQAQAALAAARAAP